MIRMSSTRRSALFVALIDLGFVGALIGGVVVRSGDLVIDASVRGKLGKLSATLNS